jgi:hypothetical protein
MAKSKFFRAFVAGSTISDGRIITPQMIDEIVETFSADTYSPRINVEHISGYSPEPPFNGYGTVTAVKAQDDEITIGGKTETRRALYCQVDGNAQLQKLAKNDQKPFPSVELTDSYAGIGKVGLVGLAFTDKPASIATQKLQFSRSAPGTNFATGDDEVSLQFETEAEDKTSLLAGIKDAVTTALTAVFSNKETPATTTLPAPPAGGNGAAGSAAPFDHAAFSTAIGDQISTAIGRLSDTVDAKLAPFAALQTEVADLKKQLGETPGGSFSRPPAPGGSAIAADVY